jgi:adhesin/invasin
VLFNLTNAAAGANRLAFVQPPTDTMAGAPVTTAVTVQLEDSSGNPLQTAGVTVSLQSNAVVRRLRLLSGTATENTDANGIATFSGLSISGLSIVLVGIYQLRASATGASSATSNPFHITAASASGIQARGGTPQSAVINTVIGAPVQVTVIDSQVNPVSGSQVTCIALTPGASGSFVGQSMMTATTDAQGQASAVVTTNSVRGTYGVVASSTAISGSAEFILTNLATEKDLAQAITANVKAGVANA